jgi:hypothetical protein
MRLLLLGATGLVGNTALKLALAGSAISQLIAPTRRPLAPNDRLANPVTSRLEEFATKLGRLSLDAAICALGTTQEKAGLRKRSVMWTTSFRSCFGNPESHLATWAPLDTKIPSDRREMSKSPVDRMPQQKRPSPL